MASFFQLAKMHVNHYFIYNGKLYEFNIDILKVIVKSFENAKPIDSENKIYNLVDSNECIIPLYEPIISDFVKYYQN